MAELVTTSGEVVLVLVSVAAKVRGAPSWTLLNASGLGVSVAVGSGKPLPDRVTVQAGLGAVQLAPLAIVSVAVSAGGAMVVGVKIIPILHEFPPGPTGEAAQLESGAITKSPMFVPEIAGGAVEKSSGALPWL